MIERLIELGIDRDRIDRLVEEKGEGYDNRALLVLIARVLHEEWHRDSG